MDVSPHDDRLHLLRIVELIALIRCSIEGIDEQRFIANPDKLDANAFRLSQIGERTNRLSSDVKQRHPEIAWRAIYGMRNLIAHHYDKTKPQMIWTTAKNSLDALNVVCRHELNRLGR